MASCELLSNFLYFCSRNNTWTASTITYVVVNCSQIFCTFAVETTIINSHTNRFSLWIALKFFVLLQSKQQIAVHGLRGPSCELLSNFLYFCSRNNCVLLGSSDLCVVNCSQIFCTFAVETTTAHKLGGWNGCELLSNFLYFCSRNNYLSFTEFQRVVVNCSQIFCTFAVETTVNLIANLLIVLWIALKFFVLLQSKQRKVEAYAISCSCELLSNFLYFCSRNNRTYSP